MTFQQLQFAVACDSLGSITATAHQQFTSVSNVSRALSSLEQEIGFQIFIRSTNGTITTPKGKDFIRHASIIISEYDKMRGIYTGDNRLSFSCASPPLPYTAKAFTRLFNKYCSEDRIDFTLFEGSFQDCCSRVMLHMASIAIAVVPQAAESEHRRILEDGGLQAFKLVSLPYYLKFRAGHPLLASQTADSLDLSLLEAYPSIDYQCGSYDCQPGIYNYNNKIILNSRKRLHTNSMDYKISCLLSTDGYSISLGRLGDKEHEQGIDSIPLQSLADVYYVKNKGVKLSKQSVEFIEFLQEELLKA